MYRLHISARMIDQNYLMVDVSRTATTVPTSTARKATKTRPRTSFPLLEHSEEAAAIMSSLYVSV